MALFSLFGWGKSPAENEIIRLFVEWESQLVLQKQRMNDEIDKWRMKTVVSIHRYANTQKYYIDTEYQQQLHKLQESRKQFIDELLAHEKAHRNEDIDRLLDQCRILKFELVCLIKNQLSVEFLCMPKQTPVNSTTDDCAMIELDRQDTTVNSLVHSGVNLYPHTHTSTNYASVTNASSIQERYSEDLPSASIYEHRFSLDIQSADRQSSGTYEKRSLETCPTCFMIYPTYMTAADRLQHTEDHFRDD